MSGDRDRTGPGKLDDPFPDAADSPFAEFSLRHPPRPAQPPGPFDQPDDGQVPGAPLDDPFSTPAAPPAAADAGPFGAVPRPAPTPEPASETRPSAPLADAPPSAPPPDGDRGMRPDTAGPARHVAEGEPGGRPAPRPAFEPLFAALAEPAADDEADDPVPEPSRGRWRLAAVLVVTIALAAGAAYLFRDGIAGLLSGGDAAAPAASSAAAEPLPATPAEPAEEPLVSAPEPAAAAPAPAPALAPAGSVVGVSWEVQGGATVVTVAADGAFSPGRVTALHLDAPPREVVKISAVDGRYGNRTLAVGSPQVARIRTGFHRETDPPELHLVVDLTGAGVRAAEPLVEGDRLVLVFASRR